MVILTGYARGKKMNTTLTGDIPALIGPNLRRIRKTQGKTLKDISETIGYSLSHVSDVERGAGRPSLEMLIVWTEALGCKMTIGFEVAK